MPKPTRHAVPLRLETAGSHKPQTAEGARTIADRKNDHLDAVMMRDVGCGATTTGFEHVRFAHVALPEICLDEIDIATIFLGRRVEAPILISSMTGGPARSAAINNAVAEAAQTVGIGFGVGSQRIALGGNGSHGLGRELRRRAPNVPIMANLGAAQLRDATAVEMARRAVDMIEADALIIHLNPLQEAVQDDGDRDWRNLLRQIELVCTACEVPVVAKEVGSGLSGAIAVRLVAAGVSILDVAGAGGTSWAAVEAGRARSERARAVAEAFRDWGIPTAAALVDVRRTCPGTTIIASGGLRTGIDCAKALRLGADTTGLAAGVLPAAIAGPEALIEHLQTLMEQLRIACFCTGSRNIAELKRARLLSSVTVSLDDRAP
jgi:isopentenyl-diphosphate delta-isomerase